MNLLKHKPFTLLFSANTFSTLGDTFYIVTLSWFITDYFHSGTLMGTVMLLVGIARFLFGIIGGAIVDQYGAVKVMFISDFLRFLLMIGLCLLFAFAKVSIWNVIVLSCLFGIIDAFYWPASSSLQQKVFTAQDVHQVRANSLLFTSTQLISILAPALCGELLLFVSYAHIILLMGVLFFFSATCCYFIRVDTHTSAVEVDVQTNSFPRFLANLKSGSRFVVKNQLVLTLITTMFFANIGANGIMVIFPFFVEKLGWGANGFGYLQMSIAIGSVCCGILFSIRPIKSASLPLIFTGFFGQGLFLLNIFWTHSLVHVSILLFFQGICSAFIGIMISTLMQTTVPQYIMGQVGGIMMTVSMLSTPFAHFLFGTLQDTFGPQPMFLVAGLFEMCAVVIALAIFRIRAMRASTSGVKKEEQES